MTRVYISVYTVRRLWHLHLIVERERGSRACMDKVSAHNDATCGANVVHIASPDGRSVLTRSLFCLRHLRSIPTTPTKHPRAPFATQQIYVPIHYLFCDIWGASPQRLQSTHACPSGHSCYTHRQLLINDSQTKFLRQWEASPQHQQRLPHMPFVAPQKYAPPTKRFTKQTKTTTRSGPNSPNSPFRNQCMLQRSKVQYRKPKRSLTLKITVARR